MSHARLPIIGPAQPDEIHGVAALMRATIEPLTYYNARARAAELTKYTAATLQAMAAADPYAVIAARLDGAVVGFCISRYDDATIWLSWFGTAAAARGHGVGSALLQALADSLPARGAHKIWCDSRTDNVESCATLEKFGFRRVAVLEDHWFNQDYYLWEWIRPRG